MKPGFAILLLAGLLAAPPVHGADPRLQQFPMSPTWQLGLDLVGSYNSWGARAAGEATFTLPYKYSDRFDTVWSHLQLGYRLSVSPASTKLGAHVEWMPAAFFRFRAHYDFNIYHGAFGYQLTYDTPDVPHDEPDIQDSYFDASPGIGHRIWLYPVLQARYKALVVRNSLDLAWYLNGADDPYYYNWEYETISETNDFVFGERFSVLFNVLQRHPTADFYVGPFYALALQPSTDWRRQRVGLDWYLEPFGETEHMGKPRLLIISGFNLEETYRTNEVYVIVALGTTWDLWHRTP